MALFLATDRTRWLGHAMAVIGVLALVGLNVLAPAAFVAERNVQRVIDPSLVPPDGEATLDADYLAVLPDDAIPVLVAALPALPPADAERLRASAPRAQGRAGRAPRRTPARSPGTSAASGREKALATLP